MHLLWLNKYLAGKRENLSKVITYAKHCMPILNASKSFGNSNTLKFTSNPFGLQYWLNDLWWYVDYNRLTLRRSQKIIGCIEIIIFYKNDEKIVTVRIFMQHYIWLLLDRLARRLHLDFRLLEWLSCQYPGSTKNQTNDRL